MKKLLLTVLTMVAILTLGTVTVMAEGEITEAPNVKIVIDGEVGTYENTPLIIDGRSMLPLRELLVNLGVQNDDEHIVWNGEDRSVTVVTDDKTIVLAIGSTEATVNGEAMTLDVAPMIYEKSNRTYIPVRFVSESLGKKVVWDGSTTTVLIAEEESFNRVMEILTASDAAMAEAEGVVGMNLSYDADFVVEGEPQNMLITAEAIVDVLDEEFYMDLTMSMEIMPGVPMDMQMTMYQADGKMYMQSPLAPGEWTVSDVADDEESSFSASMDLSSMSAGVNDSMAAGLQVVEETDDYLVLEGDIYIEEILSQASATGMSPIEEGMSFDNYHVRITINKETSKMIGMTAELEMSTVDETTGEVTPMSFDIVMEMMDLDADYEIEVPQDVIDAAVSEDEAMNSLFGE